MLAGLAFLFAGVWLWIWVGAFLIISSCFCYKEDIANGIWILFAALIGYYLIAPDPIHSIVDSSSTLLFKALPLYLLAGLIWSFYKWVMKVRALGKQIAKAKETYGANEEGITNSLKSNEPAQDMLTRSQILDKDYLPHLKEGYNRNKIINWICFWPLSVVDYILSKLLKDLLELIVDAFTGVYNTISRAILNKFLA